MRIGFDARCLQTASAGGGVGRYARGLLEDLLPRLRTPLQAEPPELVAYISSHGPDPEIVPQAGLRIERLRRPARAITLWDPVLWPARLRRDRIDLFHSPFYGVPGRMGRNRTRTVLTVHDLIPVLFPEAVTSRQRAVFARTYRTALSADRVIVPSKRTREDLVENIGLDRGRISVVPLGLAHAFSVEAAGGTPSEVRRARGQRARWRLAGGHPYLLHVGGFDPLKNLPALVDAFARVRGDNPAGGPGGAASGGSGTDGLRLVIVGDPASRAKRGAVEEAIRRCGCEGEVVLSGRLSDDELLDAFFGAELFVFPSRSEGFGLPPLEAMACGCPVIASDGGALAETLEDAALVVTSPGAPEFPRALAAAIERLLADAPLRARLVEAGRARAARLTWEQAAARTVDVYREALAP